MRRCLSAVIIILAFAFSGCKKEIPAPQVSASMTVATDATTIAIGYVPAQEGDGMTANNLNFALVSALNSGLAVSQQEANLQRERAQAERVAGQTLLIGIFTLLGITMICATVILKGKQA